MRNAMVLAVAFWASGLPVWGNDSIAAFGLGGLELRATDAIALQSEELFISPDRITVRYVFRNLTDAPVQAIVAFPLPELGRVSDDTVYLPLADPDSDNYVDFTTRVDGTPVTLHVTHVARLDEVDRTGDLLRTGIPLVPFNERIVPDALHTLPQEDQQYLRAEGLCDANGRANWTKQTTFWRKQGFPPGQDVVVEHDYTPVTGQATWSWFPGPARESVSEEWWQSERQVWIRETYCPSDAIRARGRAQEAGETGIDGPHSFFGADVDYVLSTGANWHGPIGHFRLVVEATEPWDFALLCLPGARWVSQSRVEFEARDYIPDRDLSIHFALAGGEAIMAARAAGQQPAAFTDVSSGVMEP